MNVSKIAVIMAVFNGSKWLTEQLNSILEQKGVILTVFVSIDPSTDGSEDLSHELSKQHENIIILSSAGKFGGAAKNFFRLIRDVDFSGFDYVSLADQDDIWYPDKLSRALEMIVKNKVDGYSSDVTAFWADGKQALIKKSQPQKQWDYMYESAGPGCTFVLSKSLALEVQRFLRDREESVSEIALHDWFIYALARSQGFNWIIDNKVHMLYRQHAYNELGANIGVKASLMRWQKLREGWLIKQVLLIANTLGYEDEWPMQKLTRYRLLDRLALIVRVNRLRRRFRDCCVLALFLICGGFS